MQRSQTTTPLQATNQLNPLLKKLFGKDGALAQYRLGQAGDFDNASEAKSNVDDIAEINKLAQCGSFREVRDQVLKLYQEKPKLLDLNLPGPLNLGATIGTAFSFATSLITGTQPKDPVEDNVSKIATTLYKELIFQQLIEQLKPLPLDSDKQQILDKLKTNESLDTIRTRLKADPTGYLSSLGLLQSKGSQSLNDNRVRLANLKQILRELNVVIDQKKETDFEFVAPKNASDIFKDAIKKSNELFQELRQNKPNLETLLDACAVCTSIIRQLETKFSDLDSPSQKQLRDLNSKVKWALGELNGELQKKLIEDPNGKIQEEVSRLLHMLSFQSSPADLLRTPEQQRAKLEESKLEERKRQQSRAEAQMKSQHPKTTPEEQKQAATTPAGTPPAETTPAETQTGAAPEVKHTPTPGLTGAPDRKNSPPPGPGVNPTLAQQTTATASPGDQNGPADIKGPEDQKNKPADTEQEKREGPTATALREQLDAFDLAFAALKSTLNKFEANKNSKSAVTLENFELLSSLEQDVTREFEAAKKIHQKILDILGDVAQKLSPNDTINNYIAIHLSSIKQRLLGDVRVPGVTEQFNLLSNRCADVSTFMDMFTEKFKVQAQTDASKLLETALQRFNKTLYLDYEYKSLSDEQQQKLAAENTEHKRNMEQFISAVLFDPKIKNLSIPDKENLALYFNPSYLNPDQPRPPTAPKASPIGIIYSRARPIPDHLKDAIHAINNAYATHVQKSAACQRYQAAIESDKLAENIFDNLSKRADFFISDEEKENFKNLLTTNKYLLLQMRFPPDPNRPTVEKLSDHIVKLAGGTQHYISTALSENNLTDQPHEYDLSRQTLATFAKSFSEATISQRLRSNFDLNLALHNKFAELKLESPVKELGRNKIAIDYLNSLSSDYQKEKQRIVKDFLSNPEISKLTTQQKIQLIQNLEKKDDELVKIYANQPIADILKKFLTEKNALEKATLDKLEQKAFREKVHNLEMKECLENLSSVNSAGLYRNRVSIDLDRVEKMLVWAQKALDTRVPIPDQQMLIAKLDGYYKQFYDSHKPILEFVKKNKLYDKLNKVSDPALYELFKKDFPQLCKNGQQDIPLADNNDFQIFLSLLQDQDIYTCIKIDELRDTLIKLNTPKQFVKSISAGETQSFTNDQLKDVTAALSRGENPFEALKNSSSTQTSKPANAALSLSGSVAKNEYLSDLVDERNSRLTQMPSHIGQGAFADERKPVILDQFTASAGSSGGDYKTEVYNMPAVLEPHALFASILFKSDTLRSKFNGCQNKDAQAKETLEHYFKGYLNHIRMHNKQIDKNSLKEYFEATKHAHNLTTQGLFSDSGKLASLLMDGYKSQFKNNPAAQNDLLEVAYRAVRSHLEITNWQKPIEITKASSPELVKAILMVTRAISLHTGAPIECRVGKGCITASQPTDKEVRACRDTLFSEDFNTRLQDMETLRLPSVKVAEEASRTLLNGP